MSGLTEFERYQQYMSEPSPFEQIWERDAKWLMGPEILGQIVVFLRSNHLEVIQDTYNSVTISLPLPTVHDEISGKEVSIYWMVPQELRDIFEDRCASIVMRYVQPDELNQFLGLQLNEVNMNRLRGMLWQKQNEVLSESGLELWQVARQEFGLESRFVFEFTAGLAL